MTNQKAIHIQFAVPKPEHRHLTYVAVATIDTEDPIYEWEFFGMGEHGRYAVCQKTKVRRRLTSKEQYGVE